LAGDHALTRSMGESSRRRASEFSWELAAQRYGEILSQLIQSPLNAETRFVVQAKPKI
jgi:hypothetical protein